MFGKRYEDDLRVIFDQWTKLHLGLDGLSNQKILKVSTYYVLFTCPKQFELVQNHFYVEAQCLRFCIFK